MTGRPDARVVAGVAASVVVLCVIAVLAAAAAGGPAAIVLANAGAIARHGAPVASLLSDLGGSVVLGGAVLAGFVLREARDRTRTLSLLTVAACGWTLAQLASLLAGYAVATGQPIGAPGFGSDLAVYVSTDLGAWLLVSLVLAAVTTALAAGASTRRAARIVMIGAGASLLAKAMTGHASGSAGHETATSTILVHLLAVGVWVGGLAVLQVLPASSRDDAAVIRGYSRLALVCWVALAVSGTWALVVRMNGPGDILTSAYVQLGLLKAVLLLVLAGVGVLQRRLLAASGPFEVAPYRRLAVLELALMGLAIALAAAMSSSPPPADQAAVGTTPAEALTDYPLPPAPSPLGVLGSWRPDVFVLAAVCVLVLVWWWPTAPSRPRHRTVALLAGIVVALVATCGPPAVYGKVLFGAHLGEHVLLLTVAGPLLGIASGRVLGGSRVRALLVAVLAAALPAVVYATGLLRVALDSHVGHLALLVGVTACGVVLGCAVRARRSAALAAGGVLVAGGAVLGHGHGLAAASWFGATGRPWLADALADQQRAGWVLLAWGVVWTLVVLGVQSRGSAKTSPADLSRAARSPRSTKGS